MGVPLTLAVPSVCALLGGDSGHAIPVSFDAFPHGGETPLLDPAAALERVVDRLSSLRVSSQVSSTPLLEGSRKSDFSKSTSRALRALL